MTPRWSRILWIGVGGGALCAAQSAQAASILHPEPSPGFYRAYDMHSSYDGSKRLFRGNSWGDTCIQGSVGMVVGDGEPIRLGPASRERVVEFLRLSQDGSKAAWVDIACPFGGNPRLTRTETTIDAAPKVTALYGASRDTLILDNSGDMRAMAGGRRGPQAWLLPWVGAPKKLRSIPGNVSWNASTTSVAHLDRGALPSTFGSCTLFRKTQRRPARVALGRFDRRTDTYRIAFAPKFIVEHSDCKASSRSGRIGTIGRTLKQRSYLLTMAGTTIARRKLPGGSWALMSLSPDGRFALLNDFASSPQRIAIATIRTGRIRLIPHAAGTFLSNSEWSPNSNKIAISLVGGSSQERHLAVYDTVTSINVRVARVSASLAGERLDSPIAQNLRFNPDGSRLFFSVATRGNAKSLEHGYAANVLTGAVVDLFAAGLDSYGDVWFSGNGQTAWLLPSAFCSSAYPFPIMRTDAASLGTAPPTIALQPPS